jgi:hypothetical protein
MLTLFWDMKGAILVHFTSKGADLATSDFQMFGPMKEALRGRRLSSDEEVTGVVQNWLKTQPKNFLFWRNFQKKKKRLVKCWNRCFEVEGDYVEK